MDSYSEALAALQAIIDDRPPEQLLVLPMSDISRIRSLSESYELRLPAVLPGSWYWHTGYLKCVRVIDRADLNATSASHWNAQDCPDCLSSSTCYIVLPPGYAVYYCLDCSLQWQYYTAWCMACGGFLKGNEDTVTCTNCLQEWSTSLAKSANESGDIMVEL